MVAVLKGEQVDTYVDEVADLVAEYTKLLSKTDAKKARKISFNTSIDAQIVILDAELLDLKTTIATAINTPNVWGIESVKPEPEGYTYNGLTGLTPPEEPL